MTAKTSTEIATIPSKQELQKQLNSAIRAIDKKLRSLGGDPAYIYKAPSSFKMNELDGNVVNIQTCVNPNYLAQALGKMLRMQTEIENGFKHAGVDNYSVPFFYQAPVSAWISDLTYRLKQVSNQQLITTLTQRRQELATHLSAEQRLYETLKSTSELIK